MTSSTYISPRGQRALMDFRLCTPPVVTGEASEAPVRLLAQVPSEECGCPEEVWLIDGIEAIIHFEEDGRSEAFLFAGDWEAERSFGCRNMPELRAALFAWVAELGTDDRPTVAKITD